MEGWVGELSMYEYRVLSASNEISHASIKNVGIVTPTPHSQCPAPTSLLLLTMYLLKPRAQALGNLHGEGNTPPPPTTSNRPSA
jgi:hypothetical protein